jgi:hypothetical protein
MTLLQGQCRVTKPPLMDPQLDSGIENHAAFQKRPAFVDLASSS